MLALNHAGVRVDAVPNTVPAVTGPRRPPEVVEVVVARVVIPVASLLPDGAGATKCGQYETVNIFPPRRPKGNRQVPRFLPPRSQDATCVKGSPTVPARHVPVEAPDSALIGRLVHPFVAGDGEPLLHLFGFAHTLYNARPVCYIPGSQVLSRTAQAIESARRTVRGLKSPSTVSNGKT